MVAVVLAILTVAVAQARQTPTGGGQGPGPQVKARIDAFFEALASGDPAKFEAMAREHFTPDHLAQRTADQRRQFVERVNGDFGAPTLAGVQVRGGTATLEIRGATGSAARCELTLEDAPAS